ncbi:MAG: hypothetical protein ACN6OP_30780 [Pseudomonadales bacterium]
MAHRRSARDGAVRLLDAETAQYSTSSAATLLPSRGRRRTAADAGEERQDLGRAAGAVKQTRQENAP